MSKGKKGKQSTKNKWLPVTILTVGVLLVAAVILFSVLGNKEKNNTITTNTGASPRISVDQEQVDFGDVKFNKMVTASFKVTNNGGQPLKFTKQPYIELIEGC